MVVSPFALASHWRDEQSVILILAAEPNRPQRVGWLVANACVVLAIEIARQELENVRSSYIVFDDARDIVSRGGTVDPPIKS